MPAKCYQLHLKLQNLYIVCFEFMFVSSQLSKTLFYLFDSPNAQRLIGKLPGRQRSDDTITLRDIMSAILLTRGPVATHYAVVRYGPGYLRSVSKAYYDLAAQRLQEAKLGYIANLTQPRTDVFIKKMPYEVQDIVGTIPVL